MDEFDLIRRMLAEPEEPEALERVRLRLQQAMEREERRVARSPRWPRLLPIAAVLGIVLAIVVALIVPSGQEAAAAELRRFAGIASHHEPLVLGPDEFLLIRWEELRPEGITLVGETSYDLITRLSVSTWVTPDGSAFRRELVISSRFASEADRQTWVELGSPDLTLPRTYDYRAGQQPLHDVSDLPADPGRLLELLRRGDITQRPEGDDQVFIVIGELLAQGDAPPEVQGALFEAAAQLDGVELIGDVNDPIGRRGVAVSIDGPAGRSQLVFDPDSAQLLAIEQYETAPDGEERFDWWIAPYPTVVVEEAPQVQG